MEVSVSIDYNLWNSKPYVLTCSEMGITVKGETVREALINLREAFRQRLCVS